eukprot:TRINITY_DN675_c0_g1_i6.p1 TRINITY_DN675_c0_g1~~TRINITY_DN675_c0_g1_i6.p1  ORF type:complete len:932 (-),score=266.37 TRINITY_DN675_c0_g1_i6:10-2805(-)
MERIRDLLEPSRMDLKLREDKNKTVYIDGVTEVYVTCEDDIIKVMDEGGSNRKVAATNMNDTSSRSHSIFVLTLTQKSLEGGGTTTGKLYLVDLAGSEKVGKTGATGQTLDEAKGINKSLSALGNVINALTDGKSKHVPYRDSKLTRLLQQSLGGNSRTTLCINCSPSSYNEDETLSTLRFGTRAKTIKNNAKVNKEMSADALKQLLTAANKEIATLKRYIAGLEEELRFLRGDAPVKVPGTPTSTTQPASTPTTSVLSPDSRTKLPNVAQIQDKCNELEEKLQKETDEKNEILSKQDALVDQINDKEQELAAQLELAETLKDELANAVATQEQFEKENYILHGQLEELRINQEKLEFEKNEMQVTLDTMTEQKDEMQESIDTLQQKLDDMSEQQKKLTEDHIKEEKKKSRMALSPYNEFLESSEQIRKSLEEDVNRMQEMEKLLPKNAATTAKDVQAAPVQQEQTAVAAAPTNTSVAPASTATNDKEVEELRKLVTQLQNEKKQWEQKPSTVASPKATRQRKITTQPPLPDAVASTIPGLEGDLHLDLALGDLPLVDDEAEMPLDVSSVGEPLGESLEGLGEGLESVEMEMLRAEVDESTKELDQLRQENVTLKEESKKIQEVYEGKIKEFEQQRENEWAKQNEDWAASNEERRVKLEQELNDLRQKTATRLLEFDTLKASLLRDLQNRCEKVIDLEMLLDEAREQYEQLLKNSSNKSLQKRNTFLEKNLESLTKAHQTLVNQNNALRLEKKVSEKKLAARNERMRGLEVLLANANEKLQTQAASHSEENAKYKVLIETLQTKLEQTNNSRARANSFTGSHARIAKPIRGGGGKKKMTTSINTADTSYLSGINAQGDDDEDAADRKRRNSDRPPLPQNANREGRTPKGPPSAIDRRASGGGGFLSGIFSRKASPDVKTDTRGPDSPYKPS